MQNGTHIIVARIARDGTPNAWEARAKGTQSPVGYGDTSGDAVRKLEFHFPSLMRQAVVVEHRVDPWLEGR